jgi:hypothetical protein
MKYHIECLNMKDWADEVDEDGDGDIEWDDIDDKRD